MLDSFWFSNQLKELYFLMSSLIEKNFVKLAITAAIAMSGHGRVNLKAFARCSTP